MTSVSIKKISIALLLLCAVDIRPMSPAQTAAAAGIPAIIGALYTALNYKNINTWNRTDPTKPRHHPHATLKEAMVEYSSALSQGTLSASLVGIIGGPLPAAFINLFCYASMYKPLLFDDNDKPTMMNVGICTGFASSIPIIAYLFTHKYYLLRFMHL